MSNWTCLHTHGVFSSLDGYGKYDKYAERAKELGMGALAITEHGSVMGLIQFYSACKEAGIKPILGMEAYQARKTRFDVDEDERAGKARNEFDQRGPHHLTILAKNEVGYHNLIRLSSEAYLTGFYVKGRIDWELLERYGEGLIILTGCLSGKVQQHIRAGELQAAIDTVHRYQECVGKENVFLEIHNHAIPEELETHRDLIDISQKMGVPLVPSGDCHYVNKEDSHYHDVMLCLNSSSRLSDENRFKFRPEEFYLRTYDEMLERFEPEWLANTEMIADMVEEFDLDFDTNYFPKYKKVPEGMTMLEAFVDKIGRGARHIYGDELPQAVKDRLNHEVGVIDRMGFIEYMLIVADIMNWCQDNGIMTGPGRGSAAGSLVSYCLGITQIDPLEYGLLFERFLVEGKKSNPDIDLDIDSRYRDRVLQYVKDEYGEDRVANIITFTFIKARSAIRDATRILGYPHEKGGEIADLVLPPEFGVPKDIKQSLEGSAEFKAAYENDPVAKEIIDAALGLENIFRQDGIHAAGVVITPGPITDYVPVAQKGQGQPVVTQWDGETIDKVGLLKIDFLGLTALDVISDTLEMLAETTDADLSLDNIYRLSPNDSEVYKEISRGHTTGVFQLGSSGMAALAKSIGVESMDHLSALGALYRPGPMGSGMHNMYAKRKHGRQSIEVYHPKARPILEETLGLCIDGNEQVLTLNGPVPIRDLKKGDLVRTHKGFLQEIKAHVYTGKKPVVEVRLGNGRTIRCSEEHRFLTENGFVPAKELDGQLVAVCRRGELTTNPSYNAWPIILAGLIAEGHLPSHSNFTFANCDESILDEFEKAVNSVENVRTARYFSTRCHYVAITKRDRHLGGYHTPNEIKRVLREYGLEDCKSHTKFIPQSVYGWEVSDQLRFLGFYISCDGTVGKGGVSIRTVSDKIADGIHDLLTGLGCYAKITRDKFGFIIHLRDFDFYNKYIKPYVVGKKALFEVKSKSQLGWTSNHCREHWLSSGLDQRKWSKKYGISRSILNRSDPFVYRSTSEKLGYHSRYVYQKVNVEYLDEVSDMYDIEVARDHSFVVNSAFVHNCIYQEQVMKISQELAGFSVLEADGLRKAIGKKKPEVLAKFEDTFVKGCISNEIGQPIAKKMFSDIEHFGHYSFNRSHSVAYGFLGYITAFLKYHYPTQFMTAALTSELNNPDQLKIYLNECRRMGIEVRTPDILKSRYGFKMIEEGVIAFGLQGVTGVGETVVKTIIEQQPNTQDCKSIYEWMRKSPGAVQNKKKLEALIYAGAFDELGEEISEDLTPDQLVDILNIERNQLGVYVTGHPMQVLNIKDDNPNLRPDAKGIVKATGVLVDLERITTKAGKTMFKYKLERTDDIIDVIVFPRTAEGIKADSLIEGRLVTVEGRIKTEVDLETDDVKHNLVHLSIEQPQREFKYEGISPIVLDLKSMPDEVTIAAVCDRIKLIRGTSNVYLNIHEHGRRLVVKMNFQTTAGSEGRLRMILKEYLMKGQPHGSSRDAP